MKQKEKNTSVCGGGTRILEYREVFIKIDKSIE